MQDDAGDIDSSDEDGASDFRPSKWLRARPRVVPEDALILTSADALAAAYAAYEDDRATGRQDMFRPTDTFWANLTLFSLQFEHWFLQFLESGEECFV